MCLNNKGNQHVISAVNLEILALSELISIEMVGFSIIFCSGKLLCSHCELRQSSWIYNGDFLAKPLRKWRNGKENCKRFDRFKSKVS